MTLPTTGPLSASQANTELGAASNATRTMSSLRTLAGVPSGPVSFSNLRGKSAGPTFNPTPQSINHADDLAATVAVTASQSVTWTYTRTGQTQYNSNSPASGGTGTTFETTQSARSGLEVDQFYTTSCQVTLYATHNSVQYGPWTITVTANGNMGVE